MLENLNHSQAVEADQAVSKSLDEVNGTIEVPKNAGFWRTLKAFTGPGVLIAGATWIPVIGLPRLPVALSTSIGS
jgi:hypothetical protein